MEGPIRAGRYNEPKHALKIIENVARRNPHGLKSGRGKNGIAIGVAAGIVPHRMRFAVDLDREALFEAGKIHDEPAARILPPEAEPAGPLTQLLPKQDFGQGEVTAESAGGANVPIGRANGAMFRAPCVGPSTILWMVPLPVPGRI